jgi:Fe-S-cluster containining protein
MFANMDAEQMEKVRKKAVEKHRSTSGMSPEERLLHKEPCPLLADGVCSAYEARPVACRIYLSMDVGSCEDEFSNPADTTAFPKLFSLPLQAGRKLNEGFAAGLRESGYETAEYTMEKGLLL